MREGDLTPELYERYWTWLVELCQGMTGERQEAEDIAQDTFLRAVSRAGTLEGLSPAAQRAWLRTTARNIFIDRRRADRTDGREVPEEPFEQDYTQAQVWAAVSSLPEDERRLFVLRYFAGFDSVELGRMCGMNPSTVRSKLLSARRKLKKIYSEE